MSVPGGNLLAQALRLIKPQLVVYYRNTGRTLAPGGRYVTQYAAGEVLRSVSVQAVPLSRYEALGLDFQHRYVSLFAQREIIGVYRDRSGDQFVFGSDVYDVVKETNWFAQDGWVQVIGIETGSAGQ